MNDFQFCYWLMGFYELYGPKKISLKQLYLIKEHLKLVAEKEIFFTIWLDGFLAMKNSDLTEKDCQDILDKLRLCFFKIIDPSYPRHLQADLLRIHNKK